MTACATLQRDGVLHLPGLMEPKLATWHTLTTAYFATSKPGVRIVGDSNLEAAIQVLLRHPLLTAALGNAEWRCVRAIAFDKSPESNWVLGWHQDRTIAVARREEAAGFDTWSTKDGIVHVEPPFELLERMRTLRLHLDDVDDNNGALLAALGSHQAGKVPDKEAAAMAQNRPVIACRARAGDGWLYATAILHASARSAANHRRRVLQLDFSRDALPSPLEWKGVG